LNDAAEDASDSRPLGDEKCLDELRDLGAVGAQGRPCPLKAGLGFAAVVVDLAAAEPLSHSCRYKECLGGLSALV